MNTELKDKKSDLLLELALEERLEHDPDILRYRSAEELETVHRFSEEHDKRMKKIFKMAERTEKRAARRKRKLQMVAGISLFLCISAVTVSQVEAFRLPIVQFFMEVKERSTLIRSQTDDSLGISSRYERYIPTYVPEGYAAAEVEESGKGFYIRYERDQDWYVYYYWDKMGDLEADAENGTVREEIIKNVPAIVIQKENEVRINISIDVQRFYLNGTLSYEEAKKVMQSIDF